MHNKKIIFSNFDDLSNPYYGGGGALAIHEVARRLTSDYDVTVVTGSYPGAKNTVINGVVYVRFGSSWLPPKVGQLLYLILLPLQLLVHPSDVWFESFTPPTSTSFLPLFTRRPVVGVAHFLLAKEKAKQYKLPFDVIERLGLKTYKYIVSLTEVTKAYVLECNPKTQVTIIPNGITQYPHAAKTVPNKHTKEKFILFLGRIEMEQKGLDLLLEAFAKMKHHTKAQLYIAGSGIPAAEEQLKQMIATFGLSKRVRLLGRVDGKKKYQLFQDAEALVLPSRYETLSITALEALSYKVPIVCFDLAGLSWLDRRSALKVPRFSTEKYAQALLDILKNKNLRNKIIANSLQFNPVASWQSVADQYKRLIEQLLSYNTGT